jgi:hypothetical protein
VGLGFDTRPHFYFATNSQRNPKIEVLLKPHLLKTDIIWEKLAPKWSRAWKSGRFLPIIGKFPVLDGFFAQIHAISWLI